MGKQLKCINSTFRKILAKPRQKQPERRAEVQKFLCTTKVVSWSLLALSVDIPVAPPWNPSDGEIVAVFWVMSPTLRDL